MAGESKVTTDHETIRKWAEARDGKPATVKQTEHGDGAGLLRIDFPGYSGKGSLEEITWDEFFAKFDEKHLAFLYQDTTSSGEESRFFKLVSRDTAEHIETEKAPSPKTDEKVSTHKSDEQAQTTDEKEKAQSSKAAEKSSHKTHKTDQKEKAQSSKAAEKSSHKTDEQTHKTHKTDEKEKTHK